MMTVRWRRLRDDLRSGWAVVRKGSANAASRSLEELELLRLKLHMDRMETQIKELCRAAGERAFQLIERDAGSIMNDKELQRLFEKIDHVKQEEERLRFEMEQVRD
jgi:hypothetical protein